MVKDTQLQKVCPVCQDSSIRYSFQFEENTVWHCSKCGTLFQNPQPTDEVLGHIYSEAYFLGGNSAAEHQQRDEMKRATARLFLEQLETYAGDPQGSLLEIGCGQGEFLAEAESRGYDVTGVEYSEHAVQMAQSKLKQGRALVGELETAHFPDDCFDVVVNIDVIEHVRDPRAFMQEIHRVLKPGGILFCVTISLDTWTARWLRQNWMEFKTEHLTFFTNRSLEGLVFLSGFTGIRNLPVHKLLTPKYILHRFEKYPVPLLSPLLTFGYRLLPPRWKQKKRKLHGSRVTVVGKKTELPSRRKLSVIVPAYNEGRTFKELMDQLLEVEIEDLEMEIIIVESNSTDGTRQMALSYQNDPRVKIVLQDRAQGKGNAVRAGFKQATGDFVLIQDADLEYDLKDYPALLEPLQKGQYAFVLGSRHNGKEGRSWNIRQFEDSPISAFFLNFGHLFFRSLLNLLYRQHLKDPFTMYKVFRRDCLDGLYFEANRFDFDFELVIKLVRKGYQPLEIPVSYRSRSFSEGKKVSVFHDPLTWIKALIKYRFSPLYIEEK